MKHIKSYQIFESREVIMGGILNAMRHRNIDLFVELIEQHSQFVDFQMIVDAIIPGRTTSDEFTFTVQINIYLPYLNYIPFEYLADVKRISIPNYGLSKLEGIESLLNLETLSLANNSLTDLSLLRGLTKIKTLELKRNKLTNLNGIETLVNLNTLYCAENQLTELNLEYFPNLEHLDCSQNQISEITGLEILTKLRTMECHSNNLTSIEGIVDLPKFRSISCMSNKLPSEVNRALNDLDKIRAYYRQ